MKLILENIKEYTDDNYESLSYIGSSLLFMKNNFNECLNTFGAKVLSELIEDSNIEYKNLLDESVSELIPDKKPFIDVNAIWEVIKNQRENITYAALAALVITASIKIYKNYFSKAAKACAGKSGDEKTACMTNYQKNSIQKQIAVLKKSLSFSDKCSNPKKYEMKINKKIKELNKKL